MLEDDVFEIVLRETAHISNLFLEAYQKDIRTFVTVHGLAFETIQHLTAWQIGLPPGSPEPSSEPEDAQKPDARNNAKNRIRQSMA